MFMNKKETLFNKYFKIGSLNELDKYEIYYLNCIKKFIIDYYENMGVNFDNEIRYILKTQFPSPKFVPKSQNEGIKNELILLSIEKYSSWCQVIYQLSHEVTHCFIYCNNKDEAFKASWIEETICEAMSLYFLKLFYKFWRDCDLSKLNNNYSDSIKKYLDDVLQKDNGTNRLYNCKNINELLIINEHSQEKRNDRYNEMIDLYNKIKKNNIIGLIKYKDYIIKNKFLLNTEEYKMAYKNNEAVALICNIQDRILITQ